MKNFASDFFFPTLVWQISRVKKSAYPTLSKLAVLFFDILTMPIRIIFLPTRILSNTFRKETELHKWLRKKNAPKEILNAEVVLVNLDLGGIGEGTTEPFYFIDAPTVNPEIFDKKA
ncbi:MAG: hypothetical protein P0S96_03860 [Simkaniaceae bacterium]|nr:hypothetical protein [Candidatus Sacchlamyda saccharinae]